MAEWMEWERVKEEQEESDAGEEQPTATTKRATVSGAAISGLAVITQPIVRRGRLPPTKKPYWARSKESKRQKGRQDSWGGHYVRGGYYDYRGVFYQLLGRM